MYYVAAGCLKDRHSQLQIEQDLEHVKANRNKPITNKANEQIRQELDQTYLHLYFQKVILLFLEPNYIIRVLQWQNESKVLKNQHKKYLSRYANMSVDFN